MQSQNHVEWLNDKNICTVIWNRQLHILFMYVNINTADHESTVTNIRKASVSCIHSCLSFKMTRVGIVLVRFILKLCQVFAHFIRPNMHSISHTYMSSWMLCTHPVVSCGTLHGSNLISLTPLTAKIQFLVRMELSCPHLLWLWSSLNGFNQPLGAAPLNTSEHQFSSKPLTAGSCLQHEHTSTPPHKAVPAVLARDAFGSTMLQLGKTGPQTVTV